MNKKFTFSLLNYLMIVFLFVLIDQIVYFIKNKDTMADHEFITQYRHGGLIDTYHKPSKASIKIANEYLYKSKVKFQTNSDGAILPLGGKGEKRVFFIGFNLYFYPIFGINKFNIRVLGNLYSRVC